MLRKESHTRYPNPDYQRMELVGFITLKLYHGGSVVDRPDKIKVYDGGTCSVFDFVEIGKLSLLYLDGLCGQLGYIGKKNFYRMDSFKKLQLVSMQTDLCLACTSVGDCFELYLESEQSLGRVLVGEYTSEINMDDGERNTGDIVGQLDGKADGKDDEINEAQSEGNEDNDSHYSDLIAQAEREGDTEDESGGSGNVELGVRIDKGKQKVTSDVPLSEDVDSSSDSDYVERHNEAEDILDDILFEDYVDNDVEWIGNMNKEVLVNHSAGHINHLSDDTDTSGESEAEFESEPSDGAEEDIHDNEFHEVDIYNPIFRINQTFSSKKIFRESVHSHAIKSRRNLKIVKNDERRVYAKCMGANCNWRINLLKCADEESWKIREYHYKHRCGTSMDVRNVRSGWLSRRFEEEFRSDAKRSTRGFRLNAIKQIKCHVSAQQAYRARAKALQRIDGSYEAQYASLWDYAEAVRMSNPGSTVIMVVDEVGGSNAPKKFSKLYICFDAMKKGFLSGCRPVIGVDGCFLKGPHGGQLLTACTMDPNNDPYVIAYAVVKNETKESWEWFLLLLKEDLKIERNDLYTFMSDKQKGLIPAFEAVFPGAEHRFCVRHLHGNMKTTGFRGNAFKMALWTAARAITVAEFSKAMKDIEKLDPRCLEWLRDKPPSQWSKSHFQPFPKCDILTNNMCESFNSNILDARDRSILTMLEWIRQYLMKRLQTYRDRAERRWKGRLICGRIRKMLDRRSNKAADCIPLKSDDLHYEIEGFDGSRFSVDLESHSCTCRKWDVSGIPCRHAVSAICAQGLEPEDFVAQCFTVETYHKVYEHAIKPLDGQLLWERTGYVPPLPLDFGRKRGRPTKVRRNELDELPSKRKKKQGVVKDKGNGVIIASKQKYTVRCNYCEEKGHNQRTCPWKKTAEQFGVDEIVNDGVQDASVDRRHVQQKIRHIETEEIHQVDNPSEVVEMTQTQDYPPMTQMTQESSEVGQAGSAQSSRPPRQSDSSPPPPSRKVNIRKPPRMSDHPHNLIAQTRTATSASTEGFKVINKGGKKFVTLSNLGVVINDPRCMQSKSKGFKKN